MAAKTAIRNSSSGLLTLPSPLSGVLPAGGSVTLDVPIATLRNLFGPAVLGRGVDLQELEFSPVDPAENSYQGRSSVGLQTAWAIDPVNGRDSNDGSPLYPLKTMEEFNGRYSPATVSVAATLQCVGDVTDAPLMLMGTRFLNGASLTVLGTRTQLATGCTISVVTALGGNPIGTSFPWQLTTSGVNWTTTPVGAQIRFSDGSIGWIAEVVDANNVIVSPATSSGATSVPTTALTFSVETLSQALPPVLNGVTSNNGIGAPGEVVVLQDLRLLQGRSGADGLGVVLNACEIVVTSSVTWQMTASYRWVRCRLTSSNAALMTIRSAPQVWSSLGCTHVGASGAQSTSLSIRGQALMQVATMIGMKLGALDNCFIQIGSGMHFRNTVATGASGLVTLFNLARIYVLNSVNGSINGAIGNSGIMFDVRTGEFAYGGTGAKPIATGTVGSDVRLANVVTLSYATIGSGRRYIQLDAVPPTVVDLVNGGFSAWGVTA